MLENRNRECVTQMLKFVLSQEVGYYHLIRLMVERGEACGSFCAPERTGRCYVDRSREICSACYYFAQLADVH